MSKTIAIDNKAWKGTVTISDRLYLPQVELVEDALLNERDVFEDARAKDGSVRFTQLDKPKLPALLACVEKWELSNFPEVVTVDTFPLTPRKAAHELIETIFDEIRIIYNGETEPPNG